jgi:aminopeptidase C
MQCITLKNFCNKIGFYPNSEKSLSVLAEMIGVSCSYISKLYNARPVSNGGPAWNKVVAFVESYGYQLTNANPADFMTTNISKKNKKLQEENEILKVATNEQYSHLCDVHDKLAGMLRQKKSDTV